MVHIPPEIVRHILQLGLDSLSPDPSSTTHRNQSIPERRHFLLNAMLVSRDWTHIATELLYRTESVYNHDRPFRLWFKQWASFACKYTVTHLRFRCCLATLNSDNRESSYSASDSEDTFPSDDKYASCYSASVSEDSFFPGICSPPPKLILDVLNTLSLHQIHPLTHLEIPMASMSVSVMTHPRLSCLTHLHVYDNGDSFDYHHHPQHSGRLVIPSFRSLHSLQLFVNNRHSRVVPNHSDIRNLIQTLGLTVGKVSAMSITVLPAAEWTQLPRSIHHLLRAAQDTLVTLDLIYDYNNDWTINRSLKHLTRLTSFSEYALGGAVPNCHHLPLGGLHLLSNRMFELPPSLVQYSLYNDLEPDNPRGIAPHLLHFLMWYRSHRAQFPNLVKVNTPFSLGDEQETFFNSEERDYTDWTKTMWCQIREITSVLKTESPELSFCSMDNRRMGILHFTPLFSRELGKRGGREAWCHGSTVRDNIVQVQRPFSLGGPRISRNQCGQ
ncbi:hypothetical protein P7C70_g8852, partial [Phenoliferia sp. Uapishka_3]